MSLWLLKCDCTNIWNGFSQSEDWKTSWPRSQCFATRPPGCLISHFHVIVTCQRKNRCQTDTDSWHIPVPATFHEDIGNSGEIKCGDCWISKGALAGKMSYCSSFNLLNGYSLAPTWCKTAAPSKWGRYFEDCILESGLCVLYLVFGHVSLHGQSRAGQKGPKRLTRNRNRGGH